MSLLNSEYKDRLAHWQRVLARDFYTPLAEISLEGFTTMQTLTPRQAQEEAFTPIREGTAWGHTWEYLWCRAGIILPEQARGNSEEIDERTDIYGLGTILYSILTWKRSRFDPDLPVEEILRKVVAGDFPPPC